MFDYERTRFDGGAPAGANRPGENAFLTRFSLVYWTKRMLRIRRCLARFQTCTSGQHSHDCRALEFDSNGRIPMRTSAS